jgi:hypothetical protein
MRREGEDGGGEGREKEEGKKGGLERGLERGVERGVVRRQERTLHVQRRERSELQRATWRRRGQAQRAL